MKQSENKTAHIIYSAKYNIYLFLGAALYCFVAYAQTWGTGWTFDDVRILQGLGAITNTASALDFIFKADTGSLTGRPLAMVTFLFNIDDWPSSPSGFRRINLLVHIINACLLTIVIYKIAKLIPDFAEKAFGFAVTVSIIWMLHPFLASTSFHIIQRMVLIAATFSLSGTLLYLYGRSILTERPTSGFIWMSLGMVIAGGVGFLAKENAALAPIMIAVTELTLLSRFAPVTHKHLKLWRQIFFISPMFIIGAYFIYYLLHHVPTTYDTRRFSFTERLLSEPIVLLEYTQQIFFPKILSMGPYQNDLARIHGIDWLSISALLFWLVLIGTAIVFRKRWPLFTFSVLFFLSGHLLESTIINLELYFEHRNYLPSIGLLGGVIGSIWLSDKSWPKYATYAYAAIIAILLWQLNTLWGDPVRSVHTWAKMHPTSPRAVQNLPTFYQRLGKYETAAKLVLNNYRNDPLNGGFAAYILASKCFAKDPEYLNREISLINIKAKQLHFSRSTIETIGRMITLMQNGNCSNVKASQLILFLNGLIENPKYKSNEQQHDALLALSRIYDIQGNKAKSLELKIKGFEHKPSLETANKIVSDYLSQGQENKAKQFLQKAKNNLNIH